MFFRAILEFIILLIIGFHNISPQENRRYPANSPCRYKERVHRAPIGKIENVLLGKERLMTRRYPRSVPGGPLALQLKVVAGS